MSSIIFHQVDFSYDSPYTEVFRELSVLIDTQWRTALTGRNGRGKSTLLKLLTGELAADSGSIEFTARPAYFPYQPPDYSLSTFMVIKDAVAPFRNWLETMNSLSESGDEESVRDFAGIQERFQEEGGYEIDGRINREAELIGIDASLLKRQFDSLSGGEQTRALIVALFLKSGRYPLIDEPTNHLDMQGRQLLSRYLAEKTGFLLVSHDRYLLDNCVDHVVSINRNDVRVSRGNYSVWRHQMELENEFELRRKQKLKREIKQLHGAAQQRRAGSLAKEKEKKGAYDKGWVGHRAAKQMQRALSIERRILKDIEDKESLLKNEEKQRLLKIETGSKASGALVTINNLTIKRGGKAVINDLSLQIYSGDRIAIVGRNGSGKTTLIDAISGELKPSAGTIKLPAHITVNRSFQNALWQSGNLRVHLMQNGLDETRFRQLMGVYGVTGDVFEQPLQTFSQGQLKKVDLIRSMMRPADLLIWDEPMNYIDVMSREQIEAAIIQNEPTLLFTDHDRYFIEQVATNVLDLDGDY
jgi:lincosamide and streptogramin A transport system ATP-binding/permease protein